MRCIYGAGKMDHNDENVKGSFIVATATLSRTTRVLHEMTEKMIAAKMALKRREVAIMIESPGTYLGKNQADRDAKVWEMTADARSDFASAETDQRNAKMCCDLATLELGLCRDLLRVDELGRPKDSYRIES